MTIRRNIQKLLTAIIPGIYKIIHRINVRQASSQNTSPKRILVLNGAHIGDVVISSSILPVLRSAYPSAEIGFVVGSWSSMVLSNHPDVAFIHCIDHWSLNRSNSSLPYKLHRFWRSYKSALREIKFVRYDVALCIFPYFLPDFMDLAWRAAIPIRIGFRRSMFASLATTLVDLPTSPFVHQAKLQAEVLRPLAIDESHLAKLKYCLPESTPEAILEAGKLLNTEDIATEAYYVIHMGAGAINREMPIAFWRATAMDLIKSHKVVFTGRGPRENSNINSVIDGLEACTNACDKLSWDGFVAVVRNAKRLYGVESMAGHVAAAVATPCSVVYSGVAGVARWRPYGSDCLAFTNHVACAPCGKMKGCKEMTCLNVDIPKHHSEDGSGLYS